MHTKKNHKKLTVRWGGGRGGVNAYDRPDRKTSLPIIEDEDFHPQLLGDHGNLFVLHHVHYHLVNYHLDNYRNNLLYRMDSIDKNKVSFGKANQNSHT